MESIPISIIIPVYNSEQYIKACLLSLKNQNFRHFEAIVVDDGSTDSSFSIIDNLVSNDRRFSIIQTEKMGAGHARNIGISKSIGRYITFLDSDDIVDKNWLLHLYETITSLKVDIVFCRACEFDTSLEHCSEIEFPIFSAQIQTLDNSVKMNLSATYIAPWSKMINSELVRKHNINFSSRNHFEDVYFHYLLIHFSPNAYFINKFLYYHRNHQNTLTSYIKDNHYIFFHHFITLYDLICYSEKYSTNIDIVIYRYISFLNAYKEKVDAKDTSSTLLNSIVINFRRKDYRQIKRDLSNIVINASFLKAIK